MHVHVIDMNPIKLIKLNMAIGETALYNLLASHEHQIHTEYSHLAVQLRHNKRANNNKTNWNKYGIRSINIQSQNWCRTMHNNFFSFSVRLYETNVLHALNIINSICVCVYSMAMMMMMCGQNSKQSTLNNVFYCIGNCYSIIFRLQAM